MKLAKLLSKSQSKRMTLLRNTLGRPIPFRELPDDAYFTVGKSKEVYRKVANSHSVSTLTNKDAIFTLRSRVHRVGAPV